MTTDNSALEALLARVREAKGPSAELDAYIWCIQENRKPVIRDWDDDERQFLAVSKIKPHDEAWIGRYDMHGKFWTEHRERDEIKLYTASVDACIVLAERVLPGRYWRVKGYNGRGYAFVGDDEPMIDQNGATPALALLAAILSALLAQGQTK